MVNKKFYQALEVLAYEKQISEDKILVMMKRGLESAYKKQYDGADNVMVEFDKDKHKIDMTSKKEVVSTIPTELNEHLFINLTDARKIKKNAKVGDFVNVEIKLADFGRLAATVTKQIINQEIKDVEKDEVYSFFKERENETVMATVTIITDEYVGLMLEKNLQTNLPINELMPGDNFNINEKITVYITKVELVPIKKKTKVFVSRKDRNLVRRIFETVVPEIAEGTVEIMGLARDAGDRSKVGVSSNDKNIDSIGACLGRNGQRIDSIKSQLNGEKIDVFYFSEDPKELIANSLKPAKIIGLNIDRIKKEAVCIVENSQLSLAIGKKGQNVRLAVQATGWKIDIKSYEECSDEGYNFEEYFER